MKQEENILIVGAGGIGCELLKNMVRSKCKSISIVDLDRIEETNFHRQFLFTENDLFKNKAEVAKEKIYRHFGVHIESYVGDITDISKFPFSFFRRFKTIMNAVDNNKTRRHVNRMAIVCGCIVFESGSAGYLGQTYIIKPFITECYSCIEREETKIVATCTTRSIPTELSHCVSWAKYYLFPLIFSYSRERRREEQLCFVFNEMAGCCYKKENGCCYEIEQLKKMFCPNLFKIKEKTKNPIAFHRNHVFFYRTVVSIKEKNIVSFNKDDQDVLDFVYYSTLIRAKLYQIESGTRFEIEGIAASIIPSTLTTNSTVAGMMTSLFFRYKKYGIKGCKNEYLTTGGRVWIIQEKIEERKKNCLICGIKRRIFSGDLKKETIRSFLKHEGIEDCDLFEGKRLIYSKEEQENVEKTFSELLIREDSFLIVDFGNSVIEYSFFDSKLKLSSPKREI